MQKQKARESGVPHIIKQNAAFFGGNSAHKSNDNTAQQLKNEIQTLEQNIAVTAPPHTRLLLLDQGRRWFWRNT